MYMKCRRIQSGAAAARPSVQPAMRHAAVSGRAHGDGVRSCTGPPGARTTTLVVGQDAAAGGGAREHAAHGVRARAQVDGARGRRPLRVVRRRRAR
eukprot:CAMPEP_0206006486 /NCGR_PEP_ID=MMETSP1464-20131121/5204_1 /ASSEMBLY_ACC=CAM_ASM_001124 /TAXON_ID=119497 /ORGANISM="Exanthemachrysis gayraliae, Strain RCC1523" /LENGTH=95 /DNA_ID=CAMNT_0053379963 /DNA_START=93 /DNA_END=376 /DNA_ORIENTATION=-